MSLEFVKNVCDKCKDIEIVISCIDYKEEEKKKLMELINKIKKHCEEKIKVKVTICDDSQIANNVLNYMNLFYNN